MHGSFRGYIALKNPFMHPKRDLALIGEIFSHPYQEN
jgi:hypothetical protein